MLENANRSGVIVLGLLGGFVALAISQFYTLNRLGATESQLAAIQSEQAKAKDVIGLEINKFKSSTQTDAEERQKALEAMKQEVANAGQEAKVIAGSVKQEALKSVTDLSTRISSNEQRLTETRTALTSELTGVKESTESAHTQIAAVNNEVGAVRDQVYATRTQLESTIADLKRVNGDMGVMSGLIATNSKEIDALRQIGDRNYTEFNIVRTKDPVRVGDIWVLVKKVDADKGRYTIELQADDRRVEKKDRVINEPVQFYVGRNRAPHELVVNRVSKTGVVGYLSTPKVAATR